MVCADSWRRWALHANAYPRKTARVLLRYPHRRAYAPTGELAKLPVRYAPKSSETCGLRPDPGIDSPHAKRQCGHGSRSAPGEALNGLRPGLAGAHAQRLFKLKHPDFAIACFPHSSHVTNSFDHLFGNRVIDRQFYFRPRQRVDLDRSPAIPFRVPALLPVSINFCNGYTLDADIRHRLPHFVQLEGPDDCGDQLHAFMPAFVE